MRERKNEGPKGEQGQLPERLRMLFALGAFVVLFASCSGIPFILGRSFGVWFGLSGAVLAIICWVYLVPPMPGLVQGIIALTGSFALAGLLIGWIIKLIRHLAG